MILKQAWTGLNTNISDFAMRRGDEGSKKLNYKYFEDFVLVNIYK